MIRIRGKAVVAALGVLAAGQALAREDASLTAFHSAALARHNAVRAKHGAPALKQSPALNAKAQEWANHLASLGRLEHSGGAYGENLYAFAGVPMAAAQLGQDAVDSWYDEIKAYDFKKPGFSMKTGHFTQVVWKGSTEVGCGLAEAKKGSAPAYYVVCMYNPPGNYQGQFPQNVVKPR